MGFQSTLGIIFAVVVASGAAVRCTMDDKKPDDENKATAQIYTEKTFEVGKDVLKGGVEGAGDLITDPKTQETITEGTQKLLKGAWNVLTGIVAGTANVLKEAADAEPETLPGDKEETLPEDRQKRSYPENPHLPFERINP